MPNIKLTLIKSGIGRSAVQRQTLTGLRLRKLGSVSLLENTSSIRGMIKQVQHLIKVETIN